MATPHVAGAVSFLRTYAPQASSTEIINALYNGADTLAPNSGSQEIKGNRKLNLYSSLKLLDNTPPTASEPVIDTGTYCATQLITYLFTGTDDIELHNEAYSFDGGATRQTGNVLYTGNVLFT
jgi:hypothetical protein